MTSKERVIAALRHRQPDRTPYCLGLTHKAREAMNERYGEAWSSQVRNDVHGVSAKPGPKAGMVSETIRQDEFGVQWDIRVDKDIGVVCNCLLPDRNLDRLELPDPRDPAKFDGFDQACAAGQDRFVQFGIGFSLFERAWTLRGMENLFLDMIEAPAFVDELLDRLCDYNVALATRAVAYPIDAIHFGDDWGSQRGLLMGRDLWERFLMPRLARQYAVGKNAGKFVTIHSCGKVQELFPNLINIGLDCFNPFQPEVMNPYAMKRRHGDRLSFWGGISTQKLLPYGTPAQVRREARRLKTEVGRDGGLILAPAHAVPGDVKPENLMALIEVANEG